MSYTPGPWKVEEFRKGSYLVTARNAGTAREGIVAQHVPGIANARLIAAAPELYEALLDLYKAFVIEEISAETRTFVIEEISAETRTRARLRARDALALLRGDEEERR